MTNIDTTSPWPLPDAAAHPHVATRPAAGSFRVALRDAAAQSDLVGKQRSFLSATARGTRDLDGDQIEESRRAAASFVATALIEPVLAQLRENSQAAPPFAPTRGEQQFRALADADLAQRIALSRGFGLVDRLAHDLRKAAGDNPGTPAHDLTARMTKA